MEGERSRLLGMDPSRKEMIRNQTSEEDDLVIRAMVQFQEAKEGGRG
jgi:hypothetical protein